MTEVSADNLQFVVGGAERFRIAPGAVTVTGTITSTVADNSANLTLVSTDTDAASGPVLDMWRNSANPADGDAIGEINYYGENDAGEQTKFANIISTMVDVSDGTEDGAFYIQNMVAGTMRERISMLATETIVNNGSRDLDFRVESDTNANAFHVDGGTSIVGINTNNISSYTSSNALVSKGRDFALVGSAASGATSNMMRFWQDSGTAYEIARIETKVGAGQLNRGEMQFFVNNGATLRPWLDVNYTGNVIFNQDGNDVDFRVESDTNTHALFVQGSDGKIGLGTASPTELLEVFSETASTAIEVSAGKSSTTTGEAKLVLRALHSSSGTSYARSEIASLGTAGGDVSLIFRTTSDVSGPQDRLIIDDAGNFEFNPNENNNIFRVRNTSLNDAFVVQGGGSGVGIVGIGTDTALFSSGESLGVRSVSGVAIGGENDAEGAATMYLKNLAYDGTSTTRYLVFFQANSGNRGSITSDGSGVTYNTTSDIRLKTDIQPIENASETLLSMNPVTHKWKEWPDEKPVQGFIAQEMMNIVPEAVSGEPDGEEMMAMDYGRITPIIVAALQEATNEIKALKERVKELEASQ